MIQLVGLFLAIPTMVTANDWLPLAVGNSWEYRLRYGNVDSSLEDDLVPLFVFL